MKPSPRPGAQDSKSAPDTVIPSHTQATLPAALTVNQQENGAELLRGEAIGRYIILSRVGSGGMGVVYAAYDPELDRKVAIKLLKDEFEVNSDSGGDARTRLMREAQALARLSHPGVVSVYDVGAVGTRVWIAMEFVEGLTLGSWTKQTKRGWREILGVMQRAGHGLEAAHASGIVHRDFKPENVMVGHDGRVRVMDLGLARSGIELKSINSSMGDTINAETKVKPGVAALAMRVTQAGDILGTPAYMAPEQFRGAEVGIASDVFSYCITFWEVLFGERPFSGDTLIELATNIAAGKRKPAPKTRRAPGWLRKILERGLLAEPEQRWPSMTALLAALAKGQRRARVALAIVPVSLAAIYGGVRINDSRVLAQHVDEQISESDRLIERARAKRDDAYKLRESAMRYFDQMELIKGESEWAQSKASAAAADLLFRQATQPLDAALHLDPVANKARHKMGEALYERAEFLANQYQQALAEELAARLRFYDDAAFARWDAPNALAIESNPPGATVTLGRFVIDEELRYVLTNERTLGVTPLSVDGLPRGSYLVRFSAPGRAEVVYPLEVAYGERANVKLDLPTREELPSNFVLIPRGTSRIGSRQDEIIRRFFNTVPEHAITVSTFIVGRSEVTCGEWIDYLNALQPEERTAWINSVKPKPTIFANSTVSLRELAPSRWQLTLQMSDSVKYIVEQGERLIYPARTHNISHEWLQIPVTGISWSDAEAYLHWLDQTGRVRGARFCTEWEWERAARGADGRMYPHGDRLLPDDANIDKTYGRDASHWGPDTVGIHSASNSVFGVQDLVGNVWEWTSSSLNAGERVLRGGAYSFEEVTASPINRAPYEPETRDITIGLRVCASWPPTAAPG